MSLTTSAFASSNLVNSRAFSSLQISTHLSLGELEGLQTSGLPEGLQVSHYLGVGERKLLQLSSIRKETSPETLVFSRSSFRSLDTPPAWPGPRQVERL